MSLFNDVAQDVVTLLNQNQFSQAFEAVRSKRPSFLLSDLADLTVCVTARGVELEGATRAGDYHDCLIEIAIIRKLTGTENTDTDPYDDLVQEIVDYLRRRALPVAEAQYVRASYVTQTDEDQLEKNNCFFALVSLTYRGLR